MKDKIQVILKRKAYDKMLFWKKNLAPKYVLFIKGARRVGKTTIAEEFASKEYKSHITIRFDKANDQIKNLFVNGLMNLDDFYNILQFSYSQKLYIRDSVIILDEIQLFPKARQALKTLLEDGRYDFIETGSLAGIKKRSEDEQILIPSEEHVLEMYPLDFEEFLWSRNDDMTLPILRQHYENNNPLGQHLYNNIFYKFREYMCVGGMPQSVISYGTNKNFEMSHISKNEIIDLYYQDIKEQNVENEKYVGNILNYIPSELSRHSSNSTLFKVSHVDKYGKMRNYSGPLNWLNNAMIVNIACECLDPSSALTLNIKGEEIKCYLLDTGLLLNLSFRDGTYLDNKFYKAILMDNLHINEGMFVENIVAQCLKANKHELIFYIEVDEQTRKQVMEIDFLIRKENKVIPIEVKSSSKFSTKSLDLFKKKYSNKIGQQYVLYDGDIKQNEDGTLYLPYFMASVI